MDPSKKKDLTEEELAHLSLIIQAENRPVRENIEAEYVSEIRRIITALDNVIQINRRQRLHPEAQCPIRGAGPDLSDQYLLFAQTLRRDFGIAEARYNEGQVEPSSALPDNRLRQARFRIQAPPPEYQDTYHIPCGPVLPQRHQGTQIEDWAQWDVTTQIHPSDFTDEGIRGKHRSIRSTKAGSGFTHARSGGRLNIVVHCAD